MKALYVVGLVFGMGYAAHAAEPLPRTPSISCSVDVAGHSRMLYNNTGTWASQQHLSGTTADAFCAFVTPAGIVYADVWNYVPHGVYDDGGETDVRIGWTSTFGRASVDLSAALYHFNVLGVGAFDTVNARAKLAYELYRGESLSVTSYGIIDYGYLTDLHLDELSFAGGVAALVTVAPKVDFTFAAELWHHRNAGETVISIVPQLTYQVAKNVYLYIRGIYTHGSILMGDVQRDKLAATLGTKVSF